MTYKTGQISVRVYVRPSVRPCGVAVFKTQRLRDRDSWVDVDETWRVYSIGRRMQF